MLRRLFVSIVVLAGLLVAADFGLRLYSERVVANEIQRSLKLSERPSVSFGGWPFVPHALSGNLPSTTVTATAFSAQQVRLQTVSLVLHDLHFPSHRLITGGGGVIHAKTGTVRAVLTSADLDATLHSEGLPLSISIRHGRASAKVRGLSVGVDVKLEGNTLVLTPSAPGAASARIGLPVVVKGMRYTGLKISGDALELSATLRNATVLVPG
jgi:hypothetical protein